MTDAALVLRARGGDQAAYDTLVGRYDGFAHYLANEYFIRGAAFEDGHGEALLGLVKAVRDWVPGPGRDFSAFACLCMKRQILTAVKAALRGKHRPLNDGIPLSTPAIGATDDEDAEFGSIIPDPRSAEPAEVIERKERMADLIDFTSRLSGIEQRAIAGVASGASYAEISAATGDNPKRIDNALQRARRKYHREVIAA